MVSLKLKWLRQLLNDVILLGLTCNSIFEFFFQNDGCYKSWSLQTRCSSLLRGLHRYLFRRGSVVRRDDVGLRHRHFAAQRLLDLPVVEVLPEGWQQLFSKTFPFYANSFATFDDFDVY